MSETDSRTDSTSAAGNPKFTICAYRAGQMTSGDSDHLYVMCCSLPVDNHMAVCGQRLCCSVDFERDLPVGAAALKPLVGGGGLRQGDGRIHGGSAE
ncbi:hypothetical protein MMUR_06690 [Mycolicibacterium murale]|uniref:Uncharacterized protein n=1 Tax=Mycolicibacterium murale TaxID=182220 RepID=A0A7I9WFN9_9MYCO|nr:hypothetical protein MMUR_06690 [Mycolicibacterium murale]